VATIEQHFYQPQTPEALIYPNQQQRGAYLPRLRGTRHMNEPFSTHQGEAQKQNERSDSEMVTEESLHPTSAKKSITIGLTG